MNREQENKLLELYRKGLTSSKEEDALLNQLGESGSGPGLWFSFLENNKKTVPADLENQIWSTIQSGESRKKRLTIRRVLAAASVALLISISLIITPWQRKGMSYEEKAAVLEEAIKMMVDASEIPDNREILYEDEIICIYIE